MGQEDIPLNYYQIEDLAEVLMEADDPVDPMIPELIEETQPMRNNPEMLPLVLEPAPMQHHVDTTPIFMAYLVEQTHMVEELVQLLRLENNSEHLHLAQSHINGIIQQIAVRNELIDNHPEMSMLRSQMIALQAEISAIENEVAEDGVIGDATADGNVDTADDSIQ